LHGAWTELGPSKPKPKAERSQVFLTCLIANCQLLIARIFKEPARPARLGDRFRTNYQILSTNYRTLILPYIRPIFTHEKGHTRARLSGVLMFTCLIVSGPMASPVFRFPISTLRFSASSSGKEFSLELPSKPCYK